MKLSRLTHRVTDTLSAEAQAIMLSGFEERLKYSEIVRRIRKATRELVKERTVGRRAIEWRTEQRRREIAKDLGATPGAPKNWDIDELCGIVGTADLDPGCVLRVGKLLKAAVAQFLATPGQEEGHRAEDLMLRYSLAVRLGGSR
jgi:hypothetical protein